jgi:hypothetical protein
MEEKRWFVISPFMGMIARAIEFNTQEEAETFLKKFRKYRPQAFISNKIELPKNYSNKTDEAKI